MGVRTPVVRHHYTHSTILGVSIAPLRWASGRQRRLGQSGQRHHPEKFQSHLCDGRPDAGVERARLLARSVEISFNRTFAMGVRTPTFTLDGVETTPTQYVSIAPLRWASGRPSGECMTIPASRLMCFNRTFAMGVRTPMLDLRNKLEKSVLEFQSHLCDGRPDARPDSKDPRKYLIPMFQSHLCDGRPDARHRAGGVQFPAWFVSIAPLRWASGRRLLLSKGNWKLLWRRFQSHLCDGRPDA